MRLRSLLLTFVALLSLLPLAGCEKATTPTEARALAVAAQDHTAYTLPPDKLVKAKALSHTRVLLHFFAEIWSLLVLVFLLQSRSIARMRNLAVNLSKKRWVQGFLFFFLFLFVTSLLDLPFGIYRHHLAVAYGLSVQHWGSWFFDEFKGFALAFLIGGAIVQALFWRIRRSPRRWWLTMALGSVVFILLSTFATPYVIDPLFNHFEPLSRSNPALVAQLEKVVARGKGINIPPERIFLMKASDKVTTLNAYVTGFGASKRVVVWDTSIAKARPDEISLIFGHEMGHYVLNHVRRGLIVACVAMFVLFYAAFHLLHWFLRRFGAAWRIPAQDNWAALAVLLLILQIVSIASEPILNTLTRGSEHAADVYGQEAVHGVVADPQAAGQGAFQVLGETSFDDPYPSPLVEFWTYSHPSIGRRAAFAKAYDPWAAGEQPKYFAK